MSTMTPALAVPRPVERPCVTGDAPEEKIPSPLPEDRDELEELPQGAWALLAQLQPLSEDALKQQMAAMRTPQWSDLKRTGIAFELTTEPLKTTSAKMPGYSPASAASISNSKPIPPFLLARASIIDTPLPTIGAMPVTKIQLSDQGPTPMFVMGPRLPVADNASVPVHTASVMAASLTDEAGADALVQIKVQVLGQDSMPMFTEGLQNLVAKGAGSPGHTAGVVAASFTDEVGADTSVQTSIQVPDQDTMPIFVTAPRASVAKDAGVFAHTAGLAAASLTAKVDAGASVQPKFEVPGQASMPTFSVAAQAPVVQGANMPAHTAGLTDAFPAADVSADASVRSENVLLLAPMPLPDRPFRESLPGKLATLTQMAPRSTSCPESDNSKDERHFLQVPFSKGGASGLISVNKAAGENQEQLLLSPSSTPIFDYLSDSLAQVANPRWRLTDQGFEQGQRHGQSPRDELADEERHETKQDKRKRGEEA